MKQRCVLLILFCLIFKWASAQISYPTHLYSKPKYNVSILTKDLKEYFGTLLTSNDEYLVVAGFYYEDSYEHVFNKIDTIAYERLETIKINENNKWVRGMWKGFKFGVFYVVFQGSIYFLTGGNVAQPDQQILGGLIMTGLIFLGSIPMGVIANGMFDLKKFGDGYPITAKDLIKLKRYNYLK